jgi:hypothetical protein
MGSCDRGIALPYCSRHYIRYFAKAREFANSDSPAVAARIPERVPRHSLTARLFHWIMAASMLTLLFTAFLPKVGVQFDWVTYHWIAGSVLTVSILFHIIHASFFMDFWSIWPDRIELRDASRRILRFVGSPATAGQIRQVSWRTSSTTALSSPQVCPRS